MLDRDTPGHLYVCIGQENSTWLKMRVQVVPFDSMLIGNIGSNKVDSGKGHDLDQQDNRLLPYGPCKDAQEFAYWAFLGKGERHYQN